MSLRNRNQAPLTSNGSINSVQRTDVRKTDYNRWRLRNDRGVQTWHYLETDDEVKAWPMTIADKYFLGMDTLEPGNWACEYGGPMFLLPGFAVTTYVLNMPPSPAEKEEIIRYLFNMQNLGSKNGGDGGWGLHIEADSSVFGTAMNYTTLRLLGVSAEDPRMRKARTCLHDLGGAVNSPHWAKFWLSVLGVMEWEIVNPVPPELWLLPDWVPISPWRWWIHMRQVFLPMSYLWSKRWVYPKAEQDPLVLALRQELFTAPHDDIAWPRYRNAISPTDNFHPKTWVLNFINWFLVVIFIPFLRIDWLVERGERRAWDLVQTENANTDFACLAPVNAPMNLLVCFIEEGPKAKSVRAIRAHLQDFLFLAKDGMMMNGTNGVQNWDTAFAIRACTEGGFVLDPDNRQMLQKALAFLEDQQILEHPLGYETSPAYSDPPTAKTSSEAGYRHPRRGAWGFSNRVQGYAVSDCTSEALKAALQLQTLVDPGNPSTKPFAALIPDQRLKWAADILLTYQNQNGACSSYETPRGGVYMEYLNAAEVFGRIMIEYDYPECTTACVTTLALFQKAFPDYRTADIQRFISRAVDWIRSDQRADGSWYGSWGICFTYAGMFALESLATQGETYANSERVRRACQFFLDKQNEDGGWGESYRSCETGVWCPHPDGSQVVNTAWAVIGMLEAQFPTPGPIEKAVRLLMRRQQPNGEWLQEGIEGVFNKSWRWACMRSDLAMRRSGSTGTPEPSCEHSKERNGGSQA
nr:lanosterol synthase [Quercus suber]